MRWFVLNVLLIAVVYPASAFPQVKAAANSVDRKLGETIQLREGITLKILPGSSKSAELFTSHQALTATSLVLDVEFEVKPPAGGEAVAFEFGKSPGKPGVFLNLDEASLMPNWWGWFPVPGPLGKPSAGRVEDGLHVLGGLPSGKGTATFLFELSSEQMTQHRKLTLNFIMLPKERSSFVIDLDSKGN